MPQYIDVHVLQTLPPSNLNRDDTGTPKSAVYGGVRRARVSSQAWKRATRSAYRSLLDTSDLGVRTKRAVELLAERITAISPTIDTGEAQTRAETVLAALGIKVDKVKSKTARKTEEAGESRLEDEFGATQYLIFWSNRQLDRLAQLAIDEQKPTKAAAKRAADAEHGIDVALFGRMVADAADINVDASVQVAHAISTHAVEIEQDYFTAVDDKNPEEETGAGMIGTIDFNSATFYRYATINIDALGQNLSGDGLATRRAIEAFVTGFVTSMPTGKQNTFANRTAPDAVILVLRSDQPVNLVGAFEEAVATDGSHVTSSVEAFAEHFRGVNAFLRPPDAVFVARSTSAAKSVDSLGENGSFDQVVQMMSDALGQRISHP